MKLKDYLSQFSLKDRADFAERCGTSGRHLQNISYGYKSCAEKLAIEIERFSNRAVTCEELRPDVNWAYIRGTPGPSSRLPHRLKSSKADAERKAA